MENSKSLKSNTGYKGVYYCKNNGEFQSKISIRSKKIKKIQHLYIGQYETLKEAIKVREDFIKSLF